MKALILAAGLGTRLRPYTDHTPKPLFPVNRQPLLDRLIYQLKDAGCDAVAVNTHYLHRKIESHIAARSYGLPVITRHEPDILGTGGALRNLSDFWDDRPFLVVNSDILTDIDFAEVYRFHLSAGAPATLVLVDSPPLNSVTVDSLKFVSGFLSPADSPPDEIYTFTGIQVIDPTVLPLIPEQGFYSSIDAYRKLITLNTPPAAHIISTRQWQDLGTPERYRIASRDAIAADAHYHAFGCPPPSELQWCLLDGDGSDRQWYRLQSGDQSLVAADHGLKKSPGILEVDSFVAIGRHLTQCRLPVPEIHGYDLFSGWVFLADMGDTHLQTAAKAAGTPEGVLALYQSAIDALILFSQDGIKGFDPSWTCQSTDYDRALILERECAYFVDAFLRKYLGLQLDSDPLLPAFKAIADGALSGGLMGLMHRDFQSRNIMISEGRPGIIDFQGARRGPIQYDLASLLIDPYVGLSEDLHEILYQYALSRIRERIDVNPDSFRKCYEFCRVTRNLQILGAFGFLTRVKHKPHFERYIPTALSSLKRNLAQIALPEVSMLLKVVDDIHPDPC